MILAIEIGAGIIVILAAYFLGRRMRPGAKQSSEAPGGPAPKKRKITDTKAFRQYAHGDIDHDTYREILEKNQKEGG